MFKGQFYLLALILTISSISCQDKLATKEMEEKALGLYRGKISFSQGSQYIALELRETGYYTLSYSSILDSNNIVKENGVYVLSQKGDLKLARRSLYLRNFRLSPDEKLLVLNSEAQPYTSYADSSFYLEKISKIAD